MEAWKYVGGGKVLLLVEKDNFEGVPKDVVAAVRGVTPSLWGRGLPMPEKLVGANLSEIEAGLKANGWFCVSL